MWLSALNLPLGLLGKDAGPLLLATASLLLLSMYSDLGLLKCTEV